MTPTRAFKALITIGVLLLAFTDAEVPKSLEMVVSATEMIVILNPKTQQFDPRFSTHDNTPPTFSCRMPQLYVYEETPKNSKYQLISTGISIVSVLGKHWQVQNSIKCAGSNCVVTIDNECGDDGRTINWINVETQSPEYDFEYLVNCHPDNVYKPFEWGLFILIFLCTLTITLSSVYSRAWSYGGFGINIGYKFLIVFNAMVIVGSIAAYYFVSVTALIVKIVGTCIGVVGVAVSASETLWLFKSPKLNNAFILNRIRILDLVSYLIGFGMMIAYWLTLAWFINDILAICTIVAAIKIFKIRSLKIGVIMLFSLLLIEIVVGLIIHFVLRVSYNNLVIQLFQSPLVIVFPSITPELYRKCAWLPVTSIIFPGMFISYLRRFDKSRGTYLYIIIGYISFYCGSLLWMICDMNTEHSLPLAILTDPIIVIFILFFANRRNQLDTIWTGAFFDPQLPDFSEDVLLPDRYTNLQTKTGNTVPGRYTIGFKEMTSDLKIQGNESEQI